MARKLIALVGTAFPDPFYELFVNDPRFDSIHASSVADFCNRPPDMVVFFFSFITLYDFPGLYAIYKWCQNSKVVTVCWSGEPLLLKPKIFDWTFSQYPTDERNMSAMALKFKFAVMYPDVARKYNCRDLRNEPKTKFCHFVQRNTHAIERNEFVKKLMRYKRIDCLGPALNNMPQVLPYTDGFEDLEVLKDYKFGIAFENHSRNDYTSEKIFRSYLAGSIPIYWGDRKITNQLNPAAFINCHEFANFDEVIAHVIEVDNDSDLYQRYATAPLLLPNSPVLKNGREQLFQRFDEIIASIDKIHPISARRFYLQKINMFYRLNVEYAQGRIYHRRAFDHRIFYYGFLPYVVLGKWYFRYYTRRIYELILARWQKLNRTLARVMHKVYRSAKKRRA